MSSLNWPLYCLYVISGWWGYVCTMVPGAAESVLTLHCLCTVCEVPAVVSRKVNLYCVCVCVWTGGSCMWQEAFIYAMESICQPSETISHLGLVSMWPLQLKDANLSGKIWQRRDAHRHVDKERERRGAMWCTVMNELNVVESWNIWLCTATLWTSVYTAAETAWEGWKTSPLSSTNLTFS